MSVENEQLGLWKNSLFVRLFSANIFSLLGTGIMTVALSLLAYQLQPDSAGALLGSSSQLKWWHIFLSHRSQGLLLKNSLEKRG
nr:hypothetical protein [Enterovibrio nigricans]